MFSKLTQAFSNEPKETAKTPSSSHAIDDLSGEETQAAIDFLQFLGKDTTSENIEWAAAQLQGDDIDLVTPLETRDDRRAVDQRLLAPSVVQDRPTTHVRDDKVVQILTVTSFPREVGLGWLVPLTLADIDHRLSIHVQPRNDQSARRQLQKRYTQVATTLAVKQRRGRTDTIHDRQERQDLFRLLDKTIKGTTTLYDVAIYIELVADSEEQLKAMRDRITALLAEQDVDIQPIQYQQLDAMGAVAPLCTDAIDNTHPIQLEALAMCFNMVEPSVYDPNGVLLGFDDSKRPVILDRYALSGHSMIITGKKGAGKSYFRKKELYGRLLSDADVQAIIFDPAGDDYLTFAEDLGGQVIHFGRHHTVNPMEVSPPTQTERREGDDPYVLTLRSVTEMLRTYYEDRDGLSAGEEGLITQATHYAYLVNGIVLGTFDSYSNPSPTLNDLFRGVDIIAAGGFEAAADQGLVDAVELEYLRSLGIPIDIDTTALKQDPPDARDTGPFVFEPHEPDSHTDVSEMPDVDPDQVDQLPTVRALINPTDHHQELARQLQPKFESFKPGGVNHNLNGQTNIDLDSRVVAMDLSAFADTDEMPLFLHAMLSWAYEEAKRSPHKLDVTFDEAHYLLGRPSARALINLFTRHARHFNTGLTLMSQTAHEFIKTNDRREVYENCDVKCMFYAESITDEMRDYHEFADSEINFIEGAARGQSSGYSECLLISSEHGRRRLEVRSGPFERAVIDDARDPWQVMADSHGGTHEASASTATGAPDQFGLDQTDLPSVMGRDRDLELSMEMGRGQTTTADVEAETKGARVDRTDIRDVERSVAPGEGQESTGGT